MLFPKSISNTRYQAFVDGKVQDVSIHDYKGKYVVLVFYPMDFTFVCPTELNKFSDLHGEFTKRDAVVLLVSCDSVYSHMQWAAISREANGVMGVSWPMVSDMKRTLCREFKIFDEDNCFSMRASIILGRDLTVKHLSANFHPIGRSATEILRLIDAITFNDEYGEVCPIDWAKENNKSRT